MWRKGYCFVLIFCLLLTGCGKITSQKNYNEIKKEFSRSRSYTCDVLIKISNNRSTIDYRLMHIYQKPDKLRSEIIEPNVLKGQIIIFNGKAAYIYHPQINQFMLTENISGSIEHDAFIGDFISNFEGNEKNKFYKDKSGEIPCYIIETNIPDGNRYRDKRKLWLNAATGVPIKAEILDTEGKASVQIFYSNFKVNVNLDDKLFEINKNE